MKFKHILTTLAIALIAAGGMQAKTAEELRVYINPGHGSWTANDRPMTTIGRQPFNDPSNVDTTGFFESNTNLQKGFGLLGRLRDAGLKYDPTKNQTNENPTRVGAALDLTNNICMSHVMVGPYPTVKMGNNPELEEAYNRSLSEICMEVHANNFDLFVSIHSNAATEGTNTNFPLLEFRGKDGTPAVEGSDKVAEAVWPYIYGNIFGQWTAYSMTKMNIRGDIDFNSWEPSTHPGTGCLGSLGVLKHGAMGFLMEGYFHTYQVARHRYMNDDVCFVEGIALFRGISDFFGLPKETKGTIYGVLRDQHEKFTHKYYKPNAMTNDVYTPICGGTVKLMQGEKEIASYTTDQEHNGAFVFDKVEPGDYTLEYSHPDYKTAVSEVVTVKPHATVNVEGFVEATSYVPPKVVYVDYPDPLEKEGLAAAAEYNMKEVAAGEIAELKDTEIRRAILRDDYLYVLALKADKTPVLVAYNMTTKAVTALGTSVCEGTELALSDIQMSADGVLVGCAKELCHFGNDQVEAGETRGDLNFYKWENNEDGIPAGEAVKWFSTQKTGNFYRAFVGNSFYYRGTMESGRIAVTAETAYASGKVWSVIIDVIDGALGSDGAFARPDGIARPELGDDYSYTLSPLNKDFFMLSGSNALLRHVELSDADDFKMTSLADGLVAKNEGNVAFFKYAGSSFMTVMDEIDGKAVAKLVNVTDGVENATAVALNIEGTTELGARLSNALVGRTVAKRDVEGALENSYIELVALNGTKVVTYTTNGVEQPKVRGHFAYGLNVTPAETNYVFGFSLTGSAKYQVILTNTETAEAAVAAKGMGVKGENTVAFDASTLAKGTYSWEVVVEGAPIAAATELVTDGTMVSKPGKYFNRGGVAVDNNPESATFGMVFLSAGYGKGLQIFDRDLKSEKVVPGTGFDASNGASPLRLAVDNGTAYLTDWSDKHGGIWKYNYGQADDTYENLFKGENNGTGAIVNNGVVIGGGTTGVSVYGEGADRKVFAFCEDYPTGNAGNQVVGWTIGEAQYVEKAPDFTVGSEVNGKLINTNVAVKAIPEGIFLSQVRSDGQNTVGVPGFLFINHDGQIVLNGADVETLTGCNGGGLAVSEDGAMLAVAGGKNTIQIYDIAWTEGKPELTLAYEIPTPGGEVNQLAFDIANNLYAFVRGTGFMAFSLPNAAPVASTPAPAKMNIVVVSSGVEIVESAVKVIAGQGSIAIVGEAESVSVYNMAGQAFVVNAKVDFVEVPAGLYVVVVDGEAQKVIVR